MAKISSDSGHPELYRRIAGELEVMLADASDIGDLVLAAHLQAVKDLVQERLALQMIAPKRG